MNADEHNLVLSALIAFSAAAGSEHQQEDQNEAMPLGVFSW
jgi:hypothetical protein